MDKNILPDSTLINLTSAYGGTLKNGTMKSNIIFQSQSLITDDNNLICTYLQFVSASFPISFYTIDNKNNILDYSINNIDYSINITEGNYNASNFIIELNNKFLLNNHNFIITFNKFIGKLEFSYTVNFTFYNTSLIKSIIGFDNNITSIDFKLIMLYPLNLSNKCQIKICSDSLTTTNIDSQSDNILNVVYVDVPNFAIQTHKFNEQQNLLMLKSLNIIAISLLDEKNNYLDFHNIDWYISFKLIKYRLLNLANGRLYDYLYNKSLKDIKNNDLEDNIIN
jgi:hypothetical protein